MSDKDFQRAGEYALGLLEGTEARDARAAFARDRAFRDAVVRWNGWLAGLAEDGDLVSPPPDLWDRIERAIAPAAVNDNGRLQASRNLWRTTAGAMTAVAAALGIALFARPDAVPLPVPTTVPAEAPAGKPMVARLGNDGAVMMVANYDPARRQLIVTAAGQVPADAGMAHEMWVIPAGGQPVSLGTMGPGEFNQMELADAIGGLMRSGATIAISVEPMGGSPSGRPTGPVIMSGDLKAM